MSHSFVEHHAKIYFKPRGNPPTLNVRLQSWLTSQHVAKFGWVPLSGLLLRTAWQWSSRHHLRGWVKWRRLWTKGHEILGDSRKILIVSTALPWLSVYSYPKIFAIESRRFVEETSKWSQIFQDDDPNFYGRLLARFIYTFNNVWLSSVCWRPCEKPGNEIVCRIYGWWVKTPLRFFGVCGAKFMRFCDSAGDTPACLTISCFVL